MATDETRGFELPLLLLGGFRMLIDELIRELAAQGHPNVRPIHGFALQSIGMAGATATEVGQRMGVSKQAAGKTIDRLERLGYVTRSDDPADARRKIVALTDHGVDHLRRAAIIFDQLRARWIAELGGDRVRELEGALQQMTASEGLRLDFQSWLGG